MNPDILILAAVAGYVLFRLFKVLGQRRDDEPRASSRSNCGSPDFATSNVVRPKFASRELCDDNDLQEKLEKLCAEDKYFNGPSFLEGAQKAYMMLTSALREGDLITVKSLVSPTLYKLYHAAIKAREAQGWINRDEVLRILSADIQDVELTAKAAKIIVDFKCEMVREMRDREGQLIEGDPNQIEVINNRWTFSRAIAAPNPNWKLVSSE